MADDSSPAAAQVVGDGIARDIARRIDQAAFAGLASPAPAGLSHVVRRADVRQRERVRQPGLRCAGDQQGRDRRRNRDRVRHLAGHRAGTGDDQDRDRQQPAGARCRRDQRHVAADSRRAAVRVAVRRREHALGNRRLARVAGRPRRRHRRGRPVGVLHLDRVAVKATMRAGFGFVHPAAVVKVTIAMSNVKVTVREGWAVYDGTAQRGGGETFEVDTATAEQWIAAGWVDRVEATKARTTKPKGKAGN